MMQVAAENAKMTLKQRLARYELLWMRNLVVKAEHFQPQRISCR